MSLDATNLDSSALTDATEARLSVLRGAFMLYKSELWIPPLMNLAIFASSTFTDTVAERNILLERIMPSIRSRARAYSIQVSIVDMRWGVRDENTDDHATWVSCSLEVTRTYRQSGGFFFLSLQSKKYGYCPLPIHIDQLLFESRLQNASEVLRPLAVEWYHLDTNHVPARYILQQLNNDNRNAYWSIALPQLSELFDGLEVHSEHCEGLYLGRSVTEWEVRYALSYDPTRCYWLYRIFDDENITEEMDPRKFFYDARGSKSTDMKLNNLQAMMTSAMSMTQSSQIEELHVGFVGYMQEVQELNQNNQLQPSKEGSYLATWEAAARNLLDTELTKMIQEHHAWNENALGLGMKGSVTREFLHHTAWAREKCATFIGRESLLARISEGLNTITIDLKRPEGEAMPLSCISLALVGKSGCGKTSLMATLAAQLYSLEQQMHSADSTKAPRPVIIRFCGTSSDSFDGLALIRSLSMQIMFLYSASSPTSFQEAQANFPTVYEQAVAEFHRLLQEFPVILLIDSLDQLSDRNLARSRLSFLAGLQPHPDTVIIVSTLPDERDEDGKWLYCYGCQARLQENHVRIVHIPGFGSDEEEYVEGSVSSKQTVLTYIVNQLLQQHQRQLTSDQLKYLLQQIEGEPTPLYATLAVRMTVKVPSYLPVEQMNIPATVNSILQHLFANLERDFGVLLVRRALGLLTLSKAGVSDSEMEDLLSLDDQVLDAVFQYFKPNRRRLPGHVWLRVKAALAGLITEQQNGYSLWYHRQIREVALARYTSGPDNEENKQRCHELLGRYFANSVSEDMLSERLIMIQPMTLNEIEVWWEDAAVNTRRCQEGSHHLYATGLVKEAVGEICQLSMICAMFKSSLIFECIGLLAHCVEVDQSLSAASENELLSKAAHYLQWLRNAAGYIEQRQKGGFSELILTTLCSEPVCSIPRQEAVELVRLQRAKASTQSWEKQAAWVQCTALGGERDFANLKLTIQTPCALKIAIYNPTCRNIATAGSDGVIRIWENGTGALKQVLEGHTERVCALCYSSDGHYLASSSRDGSVRIWDSTSGQMLYTLQGHKGDVLDVAFSSASALLASCGDDKKIILWDWKSSQILKVYEGHVAEVNSIAFNHDETMLLSTSCDELAVLWRISDGEAVQLFRGHSRSVIEGAFNHIIDNHTIITASLDMTVRIWNVDSGDTIHVLNPETRWISSVKFSPDGLTIACAAEDEGRNFIRCWNSLNGELVNMLDNLKSKVTSLMFHADNKTILVASADGTARTMDTLFVHSLSTAEFEGHRDKIDRLRFDDRKDTMTLESSSKSLVLNWNCMNGTIIKSFQGPNNSSQPHSNMLSYDSNMQVSITGSLADVPRPKITVSGKEDEAITLPGHRGQVLAVAMSEDGTLAATGSIDRTVRIWASDGRHLRTLNLLTHSPLTLCFSSDNSCLAIGLNDHTIRLYTIAGR